MVRKKLVLLFVAVLVFAVGLSACGGGGGASDTGAAESESESEGEPAAADKDKIVVGGVRSQSGVFALFDQTAFGPCYRMWVAEANADGGIYVEEYGKKLPIELIIYDDTSDLGTMTQLYQKLILEDKVDFLLPPVSTAFLNAAVPIAAQYGYILIGAEGGSTSLRESLDKYPNFYSVLNYSETQVPVQAQVFEELGVTSAYIVYIQDTHGIEYSGSAEQYFPEHGIEIVDMKAVPPDIQDMTPIVNAAKDSGAQAFVMYTYPDQSFPAISIAKALNYNPDIFLIGSGGSFDAIKFAAGGDEGIEGLMAEGAWNVKSSDIAAEFAVRIQEFNKDDPNFGMDWWGHLPYYASLEVLQQAIEATGTLDNAAIIDYVGKNHFSTVLGDTYFVEQELAPECYAGQMGQWQNGVFEVIDPDGNRTADPIFPKPAWPAQ
jgi:branched-chain amino acid transport system substrate-binding protein